MTVKELSNILTFFPGDMNVKISLGNRIRNATGVDTVVDIDTNITSVDISADEKE